MKTPSIQIHDQTRKNTSDKYTVKYFGKNSKELAPTQGFNDVKAVKTHIRAMYHCVCVSGNEYEARQPIDCTVEQKFAKSGFAMPAPKNKAN
jgi:hypothetical protein